MAECGTYAGYQQHKKRREDACAPCKKAAADYQWEWRGRGGRAQKAERAYSRARTRALEDLAKAHPVEFQMLVEARLPWARQKVGIDG